MTTPTTSKIIKKQRCTNFKTTRIPQGQSEILSASHEELFLTEFISLTEVDP
ncbi:hypothetical protein KJA64_05895 [Xylella fastidiosa subsp. multiplex]|uniref:hypothetical protein n=1 Tax=Xylella fastidiosa TaxID=2371 RepID=UPI001BD2CDDD|nr:hypothetical protein [Xylella fastidiosa]MBS9445676.1 hypothetical protein [Xylella fastidiosa subsp. multiplex]MBS9451706.1 hypothetical protein [Xylella fastidiosa subsp. multiplex]MBS9485976.1 hypothetical protein [Xylella fastidiosa subsp. multiplex]